MVTVLIVDDSRTSRRFLRNMLTEAGYEVVAEAVDGEDGMKKYEEFKPDIVTMDITMPKLDGIDAVSEILKINPAAKIVILHFFLLFSSVGIQRMLYLSCFLVH